MAGHDLEVATPQYVSLEVELTVCLAPGYARGDVEDAVRAALGSGSLPDGRRGLFARENFTFGQAVYLSPIYATALAVDGVASVVVTRFAPRGSSGGAPLETGVLPIGPLQIARLENDPNFPERGVLRAHFEESPHG
jgi:hypothetical protein